MTGRGGDGPSPGERLPARLIERTATATRLCGPTGVDGDGILDASACLDRHRVEPARGVPRHERRAGVHAADAFEAGALAKR